MEGCVMSDETDIGRDRISRCPPRNASQGCGVTRARTAGIVEVLGVKVSRSTAGQSQETAFGRLARAGSVQFSSVRFSFAASQTVVRKTAFAATEMHLGSFSREVELPLSAKFVCQHAQAVIKTCGG